AIGAQEWLAPVLTPAELWEATGRYAITELFKLDDRAGRHYVLPLTHEETFAFHAREIQSYKELPQSWYHFQTKDRDEPRPRSGSTGPRRSRPPGRRRSRRSRRSYRSTERRPRRRCRS